MFKRKHKIEVVPESQYTDYSERLEERDKSLATNKTLIAAATIPVATATTLAFFTSKETYSSTIIPVSSPVTQTIEPTLEPVNVMADAIAYNSLQLSSTPEMIPTGFIAEKSLETFANIMDPVIQILVAISFPVASVIMIGACFFFMFGNSEKAWSMIMNAGLGYVLIQLSPLFLDILREVGKAL